MAQAPTHRYRLEAKDAEGNHYSSIYYSRSYALHAWQAMKDEPRIVGYGPLVWIKLSKMTRMEDKTIQEFHLTPAGG